MKLLSDDLFLLAEIAIKAARDAGCLIQKYSKEKIKSIEKDAGDNEASQVVTEVDYKSQDTILKYILPTLDKYNLALLTEEIEDNGSRFEKDFFWCIDPLDGTLQFTRQESGYSVSIALVSKEGESFIGVVYDPVGDVMYHAIKGHGAFYNRKPWVLKNSDTDFCLIADPTFSKHDKYENLVRDIEKSLLAQGHKSFNVIKSGGGVMSAIMGLNNAPSVYMKIPKPTEGGGCLWDFAATACIFKEAGFIVSDIYGKPLQLNKKDSLFFNKTGVFYCSGDKVSTLFYAIFKTILF